MSQFDAARIAFYRNGPPCPMPEYRSVDHALAQARHWRWYARAWDGHPTPDGHTRGWVEFVLQISREQCLKRARHAAESARLMNNWRSS